jgi:hypothetical protein
MLLVYVLSPMLLVLGVLFLWKHYRRETTHIGFRGARLLARMPEVKIGEARSGLVKIRGKVQGAGNVMSYFHRVPCVAHRMVTTTHEGSRYVGNTVVHTYRISREWQLFPFAVDDGTGKVMVDPRGAVIDYETASPEDGSSSVEEQYLRDGDTLVLVGEVEVRADPTFRDAYQPDRVRFVKPPLISWRSEPEVLPKMGLPPIPTMLAAAGLAGIGGAVWNDQWQLMLVCSVGSAVVGGLAALRVASVMR